MLTATIMEHYDAIASGYDELHGQEQDRKLTIILGLLEQERLPKGPILDVGCGTGRQLDALKGKLDKACVGIEPSKGMIEQYRGGCKVVRGKAESLPFSDEEFSLVVSMTAVQNFDDIPLGIEEMLRVLKQEGRLVVSCLKRSEKLRKVSATLAEGCTVLQAVEEDKDIIFLCRRL